MLTSITWKCHFYSVMLTTLNQSIKKSIYHFFKQKFGKTDFAKILLTVCSRAYVWSDNISLTPKGGVGKYFCTVDMKLHFGSLCITSLKLNGNCLSYYVTGDAAGYKMATNPHSPHPTNVS